MSLTFADVVKTYDAGGEVVRAIDGVTLTVAQGEMVALYGPSGSGKTTLLLLAAALLRPEAGTITYDGRDLARMTAREAATYRREVIGVVLQSFDLMRGVSAVENAAIKLLGERISFAEARRRAERWLLRVGLDAHRDRMPDELSGGERQRVAIARALVNEPRMVLADEPTGSLDSERGRAVLELLRGIAREHGTTVILATHDPKAAEVADRALTLRDGTLVELTRTEGELGSSNVFAGGQ